MAVYETVYKVPMVQIVRRVRKFWTVEGTQIKVLTGKSLPIAWGLKEVEREIKQGTAFSLEGFSDTVKITETIAEAWAFEVSELQWISALVLFCFLSWGNYFTSVNHFPFPSVGIIIPTFSYYCKDYNVWILSKSMKHHRIIFTSLFKLWFWASVMNK